MVSAVQAAITANLDHAKPRSVPESATLVLLGVSALGLAHRRRQA